MPRLRPFNATRVPDGPFRSNRLAEYPAPDNLVWQDGHLLFTSGKAVLLLDPLHDPGSEVEEILRFESDVTAMAAAEDGSLAIGLGPDGIVIVGGDHDGKTVTRVAGKRPLSPSALCFADRHTLFVCIASRGGSAPDWWQDFKPGRASGSLWRIDLRGAEPVCLAGGLGFPSGLLRRGRDALVVSEASRRRVVECSTVERRAPRVLFEGLPGYPGRLAPGSDGNVWLPIFALRAQSGPPESSGAHGLVVRLDADFTPLASWHGHADGHCRGVASCLQSRGELIVACREDGVLISIDLASQSES